MPRIGLVHYLRTYTKMEMAVWNQKSKWQNVCCTVRYLVPDPGWYLVYCWLCSSVVDSTTTTAGLVPGGTLVLYTVCSLFISSQYCVLPMRCDDDSQYYSIYIKSYTVYFYHLMIWFPGTWQQSFLIFLLIGYNALFNQQQGSHQVFRHGE
jgi:hypothetical protein